MNKNEEPISRRKFLKLGGGALTLAGAGWLLHGTQLFQGKENPTENVFSFGEIQAEYIRQIIAADNCTSRTVMWQSNDMQPEAVVEYRQQGNAQAEISPASNEPFRDDGLDCVLHAATIADLIPGQAYEYRIVNGQEASGWHSLLADDGQGFKALIFPDSQCSNYNVWKEVAQQAYQRNPDAHFFVNMGDLVDNGEDHTQWNAWLSAVEGIIDRIPVVPVMGNHETYDKHWEVRLPVAYLREFDVPGNGSGEFGRYYYSFDYGPVHFMVLNTQWDETESLKPGLLAEQLAWLPEDARKSEKKWKIALLHKDVLQYRIHGRPERTEGFSDIGTSFMPLFDQIGIDVVFSAHLHTYRNRGHIQNFRLAAMGPYYILTGVAGDVRYPGLWVDHALDRAIAPQPETANYLTLEADQEKLHIQCFLPDGTQIDDAVLY